MGGIIKHPNVLESELNELVHTVADWIEEYQGLHSVDRNELNVLLTALLRDNFGFVFVE